MGWGGAAKMLGMHICSSLRLSSQCVAMWGATKIEVNIILNVEPLLHAWRMLSPSLSVSVSPQLCEDCLAADTDNDGTGCDNMTSAIVLLIPSPSLPPLPPPI